MKTPTHMVIGYLVGRCLPGATADRVRWSVLGAGLPDVPLIAVGLYSWARSTMMPGGDMVRLMDTFYFENSVFIALHHLLHAPGSLILMAMVWCTAWQVGKVSDQRCLWFLAGAASHSLTDLFTHSRDGLLVLWPLNRTFRFDAGIDQWDLAGAGQVLLVMELGLVFGVACYELCRRCRPFLEFYRLPSVRQSGLTILGQTQS
jgi:membrane-bound metal-dependent hydrolase YbcI (DUF457 family)